MSVSRLGALSVDVADLASWQYLLVDLLGLEARPRTSDDEPLLIRLDENHHRIALHPAAQDRIRRITWEVDSPEELHTLADRVAAEGIEVDWVPTGDPETRSAVAAFRFDDADGFPNEIRFGPTVDHRPLKQGGLVSGFVTGELGLGHVVLMCKNYPAAVDFYTRVLGFRLSDYIVWDGADATFLHCNPRHHSLALMNECFHFRGGDFNHLMIEVASLDDVGRAYDRINEAGIDLKMTFGRHTNDGVTSFYVATPSGFGIEIGYGGDLVDDGWVVKTYRSPSRWGHEPQKAGRP
ncbi:2,3-dihydroxybiphenyl 1,2-dioxygenase [Rhodococcus sp. 14C212]|uniref:VOC family protein n=1 Tax=Rhodococcus sp. 14C212 TaxID=2711209 RepID=UPI0013EAFB97|nr:VOC family protein [Rhodococcus sp. 14C212]NGP08053.1 2,3-dihydroxybiphenyl 1,2-dioxygenase [Rhodococcus sp. 14C212]